MMRHTGGTAVGEISTRSRFFSRAILSASKGGITPICSPSSPITRISRARIRSFVRIKRLSIQSSVSYSATEIKNYNTQRSREVYGTLHSKRITQMQIASCGISPEPRIFVNAASGKAILFISPLGMRSCRRIYLVDYARPVGSVTISPPLVHRPPYRRKGTRPGAEYNLTSQAGARTPLLQSPAQLAMPLMAESDSQIREEPVCSIWQRMLEGVLGVCLVAGVGLMVRFYPAAQPIDPQPKNDFQKQIQQLSH